MHSALPQILEQAVEVVKCVQNRNVEQIEDVLVSTAASSVFVRQIRLQIVEHAARRAVATLAHAVTVDSLVPCDCFTSSVEPPRMWRSSHCGRTL